MRRRKLALKALLFAVTAGSCTDRPASTGEQPGPGASTAQSYDSASNATGATAATVAASCASPQPRESRLICPRQLGAVTGSTKRASLDSLFERVRDDSMNIGEGEFARVTLVNAGAADSAAIVWADPQRSRVQSISHIGPAWRTSDGLGVGSTLDDIVKALGPVKILGFGWDYGGTIMLENTRLAGSDIFFRTEPTAVTNDPSAAKIHGDTPFPANDAGVRALKPVVRAIDIIIR